MFKYEFGIIPLALHNLFEKNSSVHTYYTRHRNKLRPALAKHAYRDKDFRFISVHVWNYVCDNIIIDVSFSSFKKSLNPLTTRAIKNDPELDHNFSCVLCTHYGELNLNQK